MHTARQLDVALFGITIESRRAAREDVLPGWDAHSRFGIVVHEPLGTIGGSYLLQLAITAFYDARPSRRDRAAPVYPDVFVFHAGGRFGDHADFDVYPPRKEVFVDNAPRALLEAINDRAITHLAVPDRDPEPAQHGWKEPAQAADRLVAAVAYDPSGRTAGADVEITAQGPAADANARMVLHPTSSYHERQEMRAALGQIAIPETEVLVAGPARGDEAPPELRERISAGRASLGATETYRRIPVADALRMLHRGPAPAFASSPDMQAYVDDMVEAARPAG